MKISLYESYVVTSWHKWLGTSLFKDEVYTSEEEANNVLQEAKEQNKKLNGSAVYRIITLSDYMTELKDDAFAEGQSNEREKGIY